MAKLLRLGNTLTETLHIGQCPHCSSVSVWGPRDVDHIDTLLCPVCKKRLDLDLTVAKDFPLGTLEHTTLTEAAFCTFTGEKDADGSALVRDWTGQLKPLWLFNQH